MLQDDDDDDFKRMMLMIILMMKMMILLMMMMMIMMMMMTMINLQRGRCWETMHFRFGLLHYKVPSHMICIFLASSCTYQMLRPSEIVYSCNWSRQLVTELPDLLLLSVVGYSFVVTFLLY